MKIKKILLSAVAASTIITATYADESTSNLGELNIVLNDNVTERSDSYTMDFMSSATKLNLHVLDTPQSVSVISSQQMEDFNLNTINDVLDNTTGIEVKRLESGRTQYVSRGFDIENFLVDGIGAGVADLYINGDVDMFIYDHVEVTRGATGLASNNGDPSATVNMVRKRPTKETQASIKASYGSWDNKRIEADVSGALNQNQTVRARIMAAIEDSESYLDRYESSSHVISGIIDADINDNNRITFGITSTKEDNDGTQVGGFRSEDLKKNNYDTSVNAAPEWAYMNTETSNIFLELDSSLSNKWKLKTTLTRNDNEEDIEGGIIWYLPSTDYTYLRQARKYNDDTESYIFDATLNGSYSLFEREHEAVFSANYIKQDYYQHYVSVNTSDALDLDSWDGSTSDISYAGATPFIKDWTLKEKSISAATNFHATDDLSLLVGSKISSYTKSGIFRNVDFEEKNNNIISPYLSLVYKLNDHISTYTSYTTTFNPQQAIDSSGNLLDPEEGINYEAGIKSSFFDEALNSSFSVFRTKKDNVAVDAGTLSDGSTYSTAENGITSEGFEIEVSGKLNDSVNASFGYTHLTIKDSDNQQTLTFLPRRMLNAAISYSPSQVEGLKVGASANWKSSAYHSSFEDVEQSSYTLINLMSSYQINKQANVSFNVNNITDKKYYNSLQKNGYVTYGAPRSYGVSLTYKF